MVFKTKEDVGDRWRTSSRLEPGPALETAGIGSVNQKIGDPSLSL